MRILPLPPMEIGNPFFVVFCSSKIFFSFFRIPFWKEPIVPPLLPCFLSPIPPLPGSLGNPSPFGIVFLCTCFFRGGVFMTFVVFFFPVPANIVFPGYLPPNSVPPNRIPTPFTGHLFFPQKKPVVFFFFNAFFLVFPNEPLNNCRGEGYPPPSDLR